ncbi:hypothetical protein Q8A67_000477 [Cirrhinus molitorella]|uniref:Peptidase S1 domain-containing protein n=1 Tax=Cirrhinus molitorella TaxID=172907 RepID=A0AA88TXS1_9TELE|nr:hypothetical protein Q8A67_000477 [Cirrhinus molitorella]
MRQSRIWSVLLSHQLCVEVEKKEETLVGGEVMTAQKALIRSATDETLPNTLQEVKIPVVNNTYCKFVYGSSFTDNMMCAGPAEGGKGLCEPARPQPCGPIELPQADARTSNHGPCISFGAPGDDQMSITASEGGSPAEADDSAEWRPTVGGGSASQSGQEYRVGGAQSAFTQAFSAG